MKARRSFSLAILASLNLAVFAPVSAAPAGVALPSAYIRSNGKMTCGYVTNRWEAGSLKNGIFTSHAASLKSLQKSLKKAKGAKASSIRRKISALTAKRKKENKQFCSKLVAADKISSISGLPQISSIAASSVSAQSLRLAAVSGTPPMLSSLPGSSVKNVFWLEGIIDAISSGQPTRAQCLQFWQGPSDGESGGMSACNMAEGIGYSFSPLTIAGTSLCYMQRAPSRANLTAGGIKLLDGTWPNGDVTQLFDPPAGASDRTIKVTFLNPSNGNQFIFIKVYSAASNRANSFQYRADVWFCPGNAQSVNNYQLIRVGNDRRYTAETGDKELSSSGGYVTSVSAFLVPNSEGVFGFDLSKNRVVYSAYEEPSGNFTFKSEITFTPDDLIKNKSYFWFNGGSAYRRGYFVSRFSGGAMENLRFIEGAYKAEDHNPGVPVQITEGAMEFRDVLYASAPSNSLIAQASPADFDADSFWEQRATVNVDVSSFSCSAQADVAVEVDLSVPAMLASVSNCSPQLAEMAFCDANAEVSAAKAKWHEVCPAIIAAP